MSRIYENQPLRNLPINTIDYPTPWKPEAFSSGKGVIFDASIQGRSHYAVCDSTKSKVHYFVFHLKMTLAHRRKFDSSGNEIEPNFSETTKVSTGYLHSSYKVEARGTSDRLDFDEVSSIINRPELTVHTQKHAPENCLSLWIHANKFEGLEFETGDKVRVKTDGDGPFVLSIGTVDQQSSTVSNYAGGAAVGQSWTDKIMNLKSDSKTMPDNEGADDDEWDD